MAQIKDNEIVEQWSTLIEGAQGRQAEFYQLVEDRLEELQPPHIEISRQKIYPSLISQMQGSNRLFIVIKNKRFANYVIYAGAEDYGKQIQICWFLTTRLSKLTEWGANMPAVISWIIFPFWLIEALIGKITKRSIRLEHMDVFDSLELAAFAGTVHHAVTNGSQTISNTVGFDFSKVDQKSKGFLNLN